MMLAAAVLLLTGAAGCGAAASERPPSAVGGELDLSAWPLSSGKPVPLAGEWQLYPHKLLTPGSALERERTHIVTLPQSWNSYPPGLGYGDGQGYGTYRLVVKVPPAEPVLALQMPNIFSAYKLYVNGRELGGSGKVGKSREESAARQQPQIITFASGGERVELLLQVANFQHRLGGVWADLELGTPASVIGKHDNAVSRQMMLFGSLAIIGLYHAGLYALRREEPFTLHFGLLCLFVALRITVTGERFLLHWLPGFPWELGLKIEYLSLVASALSGFLYVYYLFPRDAVRLSRPVANALCSVFALYVIASPAYDYTRVLPVFQLFVIAMSAYTLYILTTALRRGREGASFVLVGVAIFVGAVVNDVMFYNEWIRSTELVPAGLFFFILLQAAILSRRFSRALRKVEDVSAELRELNAHLEERIEERTDALRRTNEALAVSNRELEKLEASRRRLLTNISHDLRTPVTLIQGYLEAMQDGVVQGPEQTNNYVRMMLGKIGGLNRLIADLFELSKLEAGQIPFEFKRMSAAEWLQDIEALYEADIRSGGLAFRCEYDGGPEGRAAETVFAAIDPNRMNQVLGNLIYNALKHTEAGGTITVAARWREEAGKLALSVRDTGSGIAAEDMPYIFERFYKKDKSRNSAGGGSGIGLAIAKEIVERHGGTIAAESSPGAGAEFRIELEGSITTTSKEREQA